MSHETHPGSFWKRVTINGKGDPQFPDEHKQLPEFPGNIKPGELAHVHSEFEYSTPYRNGEHLSVRMGVTLPCSVDEIHYASRAAVNFNKRQLERIIDELGDQPGSEAAIAEDADANPEEFANEVSKAIGDQLEEIASHLDKTPAPHELDPPPVQPQAFEDPF